MYLGRFFTVDAHCHIYPEKIASRAINGTDTFYGLHSQKSGIVGEMIKEGRAVGIDRFVVQSVASVPRQVKSINEFIAAEERENAGLLTGLGTLHPDSDDIEGDFDHLCELSLHGVKLHPDIQNFRIDDRKCMKIYELCESHGLPILMHTGDNRYDRSNPDRLIPVLKAFPSLTVVGAHLGGWSVWEEAASKLAGFENLYVDSSSSFGFLSDGKMKELISAYGTDRVLFATDYPMWDASDELKRLLSLGFTDGEYELLLGKNAAKVFGIGESRE